MADFQLMLIVLVLGLAGFFYTMAGFAGGSTFTAILLLVGLSAGQSALGGLVFNVFSAISSLIRWRVHISKGFLWFIAGSVPAAFFAGLLVLPDAFLRAIMGVVITVGGLSVILATYPLWIIRVNWAAKIVLGAAIGVVAGLTGIGGGVYLAPILILAGMAKAKTTAATTTVFILLNSLSGIAARTPRLGVLLLSSPLLLATIPALLIATQFGSYLGSRKLSQTNVRRTIGAVLITVGIYIAATSL
jgi:uncharacterized membrane protein YfcA